VALIIGGATSQITLPRGRETHRAARLSVSDECCVAAVRSHRSNTRVRN
jgi:hypothetical protein